MNRNKLKIFSVLLICFAFVSFLFFSSNNVYALVSNEDYNYSNEDFKIISDNLCKTTFYDLNLNENGTNYTALNYYCSDYIKIERNTYYTFKGVSYSLYDSSKNKLIYDSFSEKENDIRVVYSSNAYYIRFVSYGSNLLQLNKGSTFLNYDKYLDTEMIFNSGVISGENINSSDSFFINDNIESIELYSYDSEPIACDYEFIKLDSNILYLSNIACDTFDTLAIVISFNNSYSFTSLSCSEEFSAIFNCNFFEPGLNYDSSNNCTLLNNNYVSNFKQWNKSNVITLMFSSKVFDFENLSINLKARLDDVNVNDYYYNKGYNEGLKDIENNNDNYNKGYNEGYNIGYDKGLIESDNLNSLPKNFINALFSTPINIFKNFLNFDFFGINLFSVLTSLLTIFVVLYLFKRFKK